MARRWPVHPTPYRAEALSSWLGRIADSYDLTLKDLKVHGLGVPPLSKRHLDVDPPEELFASLEERTGIAANRSRRMTTRALSTPFAREPISGQELFDGYVGRCSVLLPPRRGHLEEIDEGWQPWISNDRFNEPWVCENCLGVETQPHLKLHWKLPIALSCPKHRLFLKPIGFVGNIDLRPLRMQQRSPPDYILRLDAATENALLGNDVRLGRFCVSPDLWFLLLRSLLTELNTCAARAGTHHRTLRGIWSQCKLKPRAGAPQGMTFEDLSPEHQSCFLEAAALAVNQVTSGRLYIRVSCGPRALGRSYGSESVIDLRGLR